MDWAKYVIVEHRGHEIPIVFSFLLEHAQVSGYGRKVVAAGFCSVGVDRNGVQCWGKSVSLNVDSRPEEDAKLIHKMLTPEY